MIEDPPAAGTYAGVVSRGTAFVMDAILSTIVVAGASAVTGVMTNVLNVRIDIPGDHAVAYASLPVVFIAYCAFFWATLGRTPGMALVGIRVVRLDGTPPGVARSIIRALCYTLSAILLLGFAWSVVDRRRQGFHDKIARTFVVYDRTVSLHA